MRIKITRQSQQLLLTMKRLMVYSICLFQFVGCATNPKTKLTFDLEKTFSVEIQTESSQIRATADRKI